MLANPSVTLGRQSVNTKPSPPTTMWVFWSIIISLWIENFGVTPGSHVPGTALHRYFTAYAEQFGVFSRIRFAATVKATELLGNGSWVIHYELKNGQEKAKEAMLLGKNLVIAAGMKI